MINIESQNLFSKFKKTFRRNFLTSGKIFEVENFKNFLKNIFFHVSYNSDLFEPFKTVRQIIFFP